MVRRFALLSLCAFGCSSADEPSSPTDGGVETSETAPPTDAAIDASDGAGDAAADAAPMIKTGWIFLSQTKTVAPLPAEYTGLAGASFSMRAADAPKGPCTTTTVGACTVQVCDASTVPDAGGDAGRDGGSDTGAPAEKPNAGDIRLDGPQLGAGGIVLGPDLITGTYKTVKRSVKVFDGGDVITVKASGGMVPAFDGKTVTAPTDIQVTSPTCVTGTCADLDPTTDLVVTWTGGGSIGTVEASIQTIRSDMMKAVMVDCAFKPSDGKGTVPKEALAQLDKADGAKVTGLQNFQPVSRTEFDSGGWNVTVRVLGSPAGGGFKTK